MKFNRLGLDRRKASHQDVRTLEVLSSAFQKSSTIWLREEKWVKKSWTYLTSCMPQSLRSAGAKPLRVSAGKSEGPRQARKHITTHQSAIFLISLGSSILNWRLPRRSAIMVRIVSASLPLCLDSQTNMSLCRHETRKKPSLCSFVSARNKLLHWALSMQAVLAVPK